MINLELYRIFLVVAEEGNVTKASNRLNISQPAVTKHIKNLEDQLGNPLFIRTKKGVKLNEYGEKLFLNVKKAITLLNNAEKMISSDIENYKGTIKIGISTSLAGKFLLSNMKSFNDIYPNVVLEIYTEPTRVLIEQLKRGYIDIIVGKFPKNRDLDLSYNKMGTTKYIFVGNKKYYDILGNNATLEELIKYPLLLQKEPSNARENANIFFKENNLEVEPFMNIGSSSLLVEFTSLGYGIGYVTKLYIEEKLKEKELYEIKVNNKDNNIDYGIILLKNNILSSHCKKFVDFLMSKRL